MASKLEPSQALETAARDMIRQSLNYEDSQCDRTFAGEPYPIGPRVFVSVWSDLSKRSDWKSSLHEVMSFNVTISLPIVNPKDRWIVHRDEIEKRGNAIRALLAYDGLGYMLINLANTLGDFNPAGGGNQAYDGRPVGFATAAKFLGFDAIQVKGPDWFSTAPDSGKVGLALTIKFGEIDRYQYQADALSEGRG